MERQKLLKEHARPNPRVRELLKDGHDRNGTIDGSSSSTRYPLQEEPQRTTVSSGALEISYTESLRKLTIQLRIEKIGFAALLHARRFPDVVSPACQCGGQRQGPRHIIVFCPDRARNRQKLYEAAGTNRLQEILWIGKELCAVTRWVMSEGVL